MMQDLVVHAANKPNASQAVATIVHVLSEKVAALKTVGEAKWMADDMAANESAFVDAVKYANHPHPKPGPAPSGVAPPPTPPVMGADAHDNLQIAIDDFTKSVDAMNEAAKVMCEMAEEHAAMADQPLDPDGGDGVDSGGSDSSTSSGGSDSGGSGAVMSGGYVADGGALKDKDGNYIKPPRS